MLGIELLLGNEELGRADKFGWTDELLGIELLLGDEELLATDVLFGTEDEPVAMDELLGTEDPLRGTDELNKETDKYELDKPVGVSTSITTSGVTAPSVPVLKVVVVS